MVLKNGRNDYIGDNPVTKIKLVPRFVNEVDNF